MALLCTSLYDCLLSIVDWAIQHGFLGRFLLEFLWSCELSVGSIAYGTNAISAFETYYDMIRCYEMNRLPSHANAVAHSIP
jgi:hypothetical protein